MRAFIIKIAMFTLILTISCSNDDGPKPSCFQDENRRIVKTIKETEGTILGSQCSTTTIYLIDPLHQEQRGPTGKFGPCNLSEEFRIDGARVVFSGYLYEQFETENICADFFEITEIRFDD